jgi:hypothetical protein
MAGSGLPDLGVQLVRRWCTQGVLGHVRDQDRVECDAGSRYLTTAPIRPSSGRNAVGTALPFDGHVGLA